jgi:predicted nucleic acid-binding protein
VVIIDTTVWIDYLRGTENPETQWLNGALHQKRFGLTDIILCEVLQGIRHEKVFKQVQAELLRFQIFHTAGTALALAAAQNYRGLRGRGYTVRKTIDCLIATFCLLAGHELLHRDHDCDPFENVLGMRVVHPS